MNKSPLSLPTFGLSRGCGQANCRRQVGLRSSWSYPKVSSLSCWSFGGGRRPYRRASELVYRLRRDVSCPPCRKRRRATFQRGRRGCHVSRHINPSWRELSLFRSLGWPITAPAKLRSRTRTCLWRTISFRKRCVSFRSALPKPSGISSGYAMHEANEFQPYLTESFSALRLNIRFPALGNSGLWPRNTRHPC